MSNMKFNATKFNALMQRKLKQKGMSARKFADEYKLARAPFSKAMCGMTRPSLDSLNRWCKALECTPEERAEIIASVYIDDGEPSSRVA